MINYLFTSILLFLVLIITLKYIYSSRKRLPLPPCPFPWPLIGNLLQIVTVRTKELFGAGTETTTVTSEWMLVELLKNHQCLTKLRDEIANIVGDKDVRIRESDLTSMPYLDACLKETLRLHPPGPLLLPHRAVETCEVMGYRILKDTQVMVNMWAIASDPKVWDDPSSFKPERFMNSKMDYKGRDFEYIPFVVASLIHKFDWFLPNDMNPDQIDMDEILDLIISKKDPILVIPKLRK
ncbi:hypothetical protein H5410_031898 [Solanum commersonii]|uniref:Cytochrome P450 n=1 Tax=Solanum commersonii TaxID=4109 RepID=A0A9J5YLG8_SOLCO|nr:hypothetical protein H5410_031898 [Solanum commersonii]